jgi:ABC-type lipopolysaccharide export system ATPase subunit
MFEDLFGCDVGELDEAGVLAAADSRALRERLEVLDLLHALRIADLHHEARTTGPGGERRRVYGGAGCR